MKQRTSIMDAARAAEAKRRASRGRKPSMNGVFETGAASEKLADRPTIVITPAEHEVNDAAIVALATDPDLYQRGELLVRLAGESGESGEYLPADGKSPSIRRAGGMRIDAVLPPSLRERLTRVAIWVKPSTTRDGVQEHRIVHPPGWCVNAVHARGYWPGIRALGAVVEYPTIRPDGEILTRQGYDAQTGLYYAPAGRVDDVPGNPSSRDIRAAIAALDEVICDFPFESDAHRAGWFAALLTPLARFSFAGPSPLFLADANVRAAGKTLLIETIGYLITGRPMTVSTFTGDQDEMRKRITALAIAGDRLVLLDNLTGQIRNPVLDAALTSETWQDRLLGVNRTISAPMLMVWYASGNNCSLFSDTARRTCRIRLESPEENPERRDNFRHPDLVGWVQANRPRLLAAALTILRGFHSAGRPDQGLAAWGSYAGWSGMVRNAVVWAGLADPGETRVSITDHDPTAEALGVLLNSWRRADPHGRGLTAGEFLSMIRPDSKGLPPEWATDAIAALDVLLARLDARGLGNCLRSYRRRIVAGLFFDRAGEYQRAVRWTVRTAREFSIGRQTLTGLTGLTAPTHQETTP